MKIGDLVKDNQILIEYVNNKNGYWAGVKGLNFVGASKKAGITGLKPISINSGFIIWNGHQKAFDIALKLIKSKVIFDPKGISGDEYYICAGLQKAKANIVPLDYDLVKLGKFWNGNINLYNERLISSYYSKNDRIICHYGNHNYYHPSVRKILDKFDIELEKDLKTYFKILNNLLRTLIRSIRDYLN